MTERRTLVMLAGWACALVLVGVVIGVSFKPSPPSANHCVAAAIAREEASEAFADAHRYDQAGAHAMGDRHRDYGLFSQRLAAKFDPDHRCPERGTS